MVGIRKNCPHCKHRQFIPVQIIVENDTIKIEEPYIACDMCLEEFKIELQFRATTKY